MRPRDLEKERRILACALEVVGREGLAGFSMDAVAKAAGVAIGTLYIYFANKDALLEALYLDTKRAFARSILEGVDASRPVRPAFESMAVGYLAYVAKNHASIAFLQQFRSSSLYGEEARAVSAEIVAPIATLLERGKAEGLLKDLPVPMMIAFLQGTIAEMAAYIEALPKKARPEQRLVVAKLAWDAIKA